MSYYGGNYNGGREYLPSTILGNDSTTILKTTSLCLLIIYILVRFGMTAVREGPKAIYSSIELWGGPVLLVLLLSGYASVNPDASGVPSQFFLTAVLLYAIWMVLISWFV